MAKPLRVLIVEDSADDAELIVRELRRGGFQPEYERVDTPEGMVAAFERSEWDIVLSDYSMPQFSAPAAMEMVRQKGMDVPLVIISGSIGEERAVEMIRAGASDYLLKDRIARLVPAVERELRAVSMRRERKRMAEALQESEARYRTLFEDAQDGIGLADAETGRLVDCNHALCRMVEREKAELVGQPQSFMHPPEDLADGQSSTFRGHQTGDPGKTTEDRLMSKSGKLVPVEIRAARIQVNGRDCLLGIFRNITERKGAEEALQASQAQLRQAQKMEAIGNLAGGVAHDFNNILMVINGYSQLLLMELPPDSPIRPQLEEIKKAGDRAAGLTRQLLMISRKQVINPGILDLNAIVKGMEKMLRRVIREDIEPRMRLAADLWKVKADPGQMEQILLNLTANARDAMPQGGELTLETSNAEVDEKGAFWHERVAPGQYVVLTFSDTGVGMNAETRSRIFEPFFTTKGTGEGTGLGLSIVHGIVKQSGGHIWLYSEPGHGTILKVYLPRAKECAEPPRPPEEPVTSVRGTETILLVEDEAAVRAVVREALAGQGYVLLEAFDGDQALQIAREHSGTIDLLITDMIMPRMGGPELAGKLGAARPGVQVLFMSGYADHAAVPNGTLKTGANYLQKPFTLEALTHRVREVLDAAGKPG